MKEVLTIQKQIILNDKLSENLTTNFSGPIIFSYVWWILNTAWQRGISKLYFLARDGYLLCKVAEKIRTHFSLPIQCCYLYCSRTSLRMPSYHLLKEEEMYHLLFQGGYRVTLRSVLERANLDRQERKNVYTDCGILNPDEEYLLNAKELENLRQILKSSKLLRSLILEKSYSAYQQTIGYFKQEGLLDSKQIALVDSGWTGSMQRSLRQLLSSSGYTGRLIGFYFGMYVKPQSSEDGEYLTWYFDNRNRIRDKICFSNNLFECLLSAPHGMTLGYELKNGSYTPIFSKAQDSAELERIQNHTRQVLDYVQKSIKGIDFDVFQAQEHRRRTRKIILRYMAHPTRDEAHFYGKIRFCDDVTEGYHLSLAEEGQLPVLKNYLFLPRVIHRLKQRGGGQQVALVWPYGTIAFLPKWKQAWYRWNVYLWEWIRYVRH